MLHNKTLFPPDLKKQTKIKQLAPTRTLLFSLSFPALRWHIFLPTPDCSFIRPYLLSSGWKQLFREFFFLLHLLIYFLSPSACGGQRTTCRVHSLPPSCGYWGIQQHFGHQAWPQVPFPLSHFASPLGMF